MGMNGLDAGKAGEVGGVQSEDVRDVVDEHGGGEPGVMDLDASNVVGLDEGAPSSIDLYIIGKKCKLVLDILQPLCHFMERTTVAVALNGTGEDIPKLRRIPKGEKERTIFYAQAINCCLTKTIPLEARSCQTQQDVGVDQIA